MNKEPSETPDDKTLLETLLMCAGSSVSEDEIITKMPPLINLHDLISQLKEDYRNRSLEIVEISTKHWGIRTKPEYSDLCRKALRPPLKLSRAATETLYIVAYFQPVTRGEIEKIRGVKSSRGVFDVLLFNELIVPSGRRQGPGNPLKFVTTQKFLESFNFNSLEALPGLERARAEGLINRDIGIDLPTSERNDEETE